jgi:LysM repeat protein
MRRPSRTVFSPDETPACRFLLSRRLEIPMTFPERRPRLTRTVPSWGVGIALVAGPLLSAPPAAAHPAPPAHGADASPSSYTVVPGDSVSEIALRTGSTVDAIVAANHLDSRALIRIGQRLTIPSAAAAPAAPAPRPTGDRIHEVRAGDSVWQIARDTGTSVESIVAANGLDSRALIRIGQRLTIPSGTAPAPAAAPRAPASPPLVGDTFLGRTYPGTTVAAANANKAALLARPAPTREEMRDMIEEVARIMGVDPSLALAVGYQESGFDQRAVSPANAIGAMQVIPSSGQWASQLVGRPLDLLDPWDNATAGVAILRQLVRSTPDLPTAIASYYQGLAGVRRHGMYPDTRRYVASVQTLMTRFP